MSAGASLGAAAATLAVLAAASSLMGAPAAATEARARRRARAAAPPTDTGPVRRLVAHRWLADDWAPVRRLLAVVVSLAGQPDRASRRADQALPALLDQVTRQLRSGGSLTVAVGAAAAGSPDRGTVRLADDLTAGVALGEAVERWRAASPTPARALVAAALGLSAEAGGAVAVVLDGVTDTLRERVALDREVAALSSQARASAAVLVAAPVAFTVLAAGADGRVASALFGQPLGWACLAGGAVLDTAGALWMARLVARAR